MDSPVGLRRGNFENEAPLRILSLDGGGVRGYSMLLLVQAFMHRTIEKCEGVPPSDDQSRPCEYFDLIAGTGTGGLIAIMLGRLRMSIKECLQTYEEMTKFVFETDKTIAGIPYRSTLFKASKLEDAIRDSVRKYADRNDDEPADQFIEMPKSPRRAGSMHSYNSTLQRRSTSSTLRRSSYLPASVGRGDPNADLEDYRPNATKTAVTAVFKGTTRSSGASTFLRSYRSRTKPPVESRCTIWQAGRATCATKLAFKPIQIGGSIFLDEGEGMLSLDGKPTYNPAPQILDEATTNEWPGRKVGVFLSIGTGKRPSTNRGAQHEWWEGFAGGMGEFAEAKRKLILKIEGCDQTHKDMESTHLRKRGVDPRNYFRLDVDVGVGEVGMNEWDRIFQIKRNTIAYLNQQGVQDIIERGVTEMQDIYELQRPAPPTITQRFDQYEQSALSSIPPPSDPYAVELPGADVPSSYPRPLNKPGPQYPAPHTRSYPSDYNVQDKFTIMPTPDEKFSVLSLDDSTPHEDQSPYRGSEESAYRRSNEFSPNSRPPTSDNNLDSQRRSNEAYRQSVPPPLPPKTPIQFYEGGDGRRHTVPNRHNGPNGHNGHVMLPYPDADGPPPVVNMARKPAYVPR